MFAICKRKPAAGVEHAQAPDQAGPGPGEVKIAVAKAGICGTDFHIYKWDAWSSARLKPPLILGHEFVGRIVETGGGVTQLGPGQRVSAECHVACGHCHQCRTGLAHLCARTRIIGVDRPGCFAETVIVPAANVWPVDDRIPDRHAALFDPVGNAMHAVVTAEVTGHDVLITGAGAIGLFAIAIARARGARSVTVHEPNAYRAALAQRLGADFVFDPRREGAEARSRAVTGGRGFDAVLEMSGQETAVRAACRLATAGGRVVLLGLPEGQVTLDLAGEVIMKGLTLSGISGRRMFETWYQVERFILEHGAALDTIVTHELPAADYAAGFSLMASGNCGKVLLDFSDLAQRAA